MFDYIASDRISALTKSYAEISELIEQLEKSFDELQKRIENLEKQQTNNEPEKL